MENLDKNNSTEINDLRNQIESTGIDTSQWGKGSSKTLEHLKKEIDNKETILIKDKNGELLRKVVVGCADIYHETQEGEKFRLIEEKQIFKDGRERKRDLGQAVSEKIQIGEDTEEAMLRGIEEELGIKGEIDLEKNGEDIEIKTSDSYPGLKSQYENHRFTVFLNSSQFNLGGYIEEQEDKSTYFIWNKIN